MSEPTNIDDLLLSGKNTTQPQAPEHSEDTSSDFESSPDEPEELTSEPEETGDIEEEDAPPTPKKSKDYDDYGNPKAPSRTYTEEEHNEILNKKIRERLSRGNSSNQQIPNLSQDSGSDSESDDTWEAQLEKVIEKTVSKISQKQVYEANQQRERHAEEQFRDKFVQGMDRFGDFREVVEAQPVTDHMTLALRGMSDPSAFIYAASKRHAGELQRISQIPDPYAQMVEMGKLEERIRKAPVTTKTPRPIQKNQDDSHFPASKKNKEETIEDRIAQSDAKRLTQIKQRRGR